MQTKTNDDPLKKMTKSQKIGILGGVLGTAAQFIPGVGPVISAGINAATQGIQQNVAGKEAEAAAGEQAKKSSAASLVASNESAMNAASNLGAKPVYNPNDPYGTGVDLNTIKKTGKVLKPITTYYGEPKNLSALTYKKGLLMKTLSGVETLKENNTLKKEGDLGMQSVKYGIDNNPEITAADPKAKFIAKNKK